MGRRKQRVRMHLQDGPSIEGVFASRTRHEYVLWAPHVVPEDGTKPDQIAGHVAIPRERVLWWQVLSD